MMVDDRLFLHRQEGELTDEFANLWVPRTFNPQRHGGTCPVCGWGLEAGDSVYVAEETFPATLLEAPAMAVHQRCTCILSEEDWDPGVWQP